MARRGVSRRFLNYCVSLMEKKECLVELYLLLCAQNGKEEWLVELRSIYYCAPNGNEREWLVDLYLLCVPNGKEEWLVDFYLLCP